MKCEIVSWDLEHPIDENKLNAALKSVFDGKNCPQGYLVEAMDKNGDDAYMLMITSKEATSEQVMNLYDEMTETVGMQQKQTNHRVP